MVTMCQQLVGVDIEDSEPMSYCELALLNAKPCKGPCVVETGSGICAAGIQQQTCSWLFIGKGDPCEVEEVLGWPRIKASTEDHALTTAGCITIFRLKDFTIQLRF